MFEPLNTKITTNSSDFFGGRLLAGAVVKLSKYPASCMATRSLYNFVTSITKYFDISLNES
jgi:hypothetical protein